MPAHRCSHHRASAAPTPRTLPLRVLSTLALILPVILLIISFSLSLATIYSHEWAVQDIYDEVGNHTRYHNYRAPFYQCNQTGVINEDIEVSGPNTTCERTHGIGLRGFDTCLQLDPKDYHLCQQTALTANLLVAGVVFIALAMALAATVLGLSVKAASAATTAPATTPAKDATPQELAVPTPETVTASAGLDATQLLLCLLGSAMLLLAQIVGVNALVNDALPNANFDEADANTPGNALNITSWYMGKASYTFISVAWLAGFLAAYIARFDIW
jgi:hypothetical protein